MTHKLRPPDSRTRTLAPEACSAPDAGALKTIEAFEALGIAVFPEIRGVKGTRVKGWPDMPVDQALTLARHAAMRGPTNLAGRAGNRVAVLDLDAKEGVKPETALPELLDLLGHAVVAVVRTSRGFHIWVRCTDPVGNGFCSKLGGDVFSEPHLAMLPPSVHPTGTAYEWVIEPRQPSEAVDLAAHGIVPDEHLSVSRPSFRVTEAPAPIRSEFAELMEEMGLHRPGRAQDLVRCPWHDDAQPSLSINWDAAVFHCFGEQCSVQGGIGSLRRLMGRDTPTCRLWDARSPVGKSGCAERTRDRLAAALLALHQPDKARRVKECRTIFAVGECSNCGINPAYPLSCGLPFCTTCMPGRLASSWKEHEAELPERLTLLRLRPRDLWGIDARQVKRVRARFSEWRKRIQITAGIYGIRLEWGRGVNVLLAIPASESVPDSSRAFSVEVVAEDCAPADYLRWLIEEYMAEAEGWETDADLALLMQETNRRRRFQGFGCAYATERRQPDEANADQPTLTAQPTPSSLPDQVAPKPLSKISGGSKKTRKEIHLCPLCHGPVRMLAFTVRQEEAELRDGFLQWKRTPGRKEAA